MKSWNELSMAEKADVMKLAIEGGVYDLDSIRTGYNKFAEGGSKEEEEEVNTIVPFTQRREVIITPDSEYNQYLNTLPDNQRFTPNDKYDSYFYWKLNGRPRNFEEAYNKGMFHYDHSDNVYHANSIAFDDNTGVGYFMKPKTHDTVGYELDWFNKGLVTEEGGKQRPVTPEEAKELEEFRRNYFLTDDPDRPNYYRYQPIEKAEGGGIHIKPSHRGRLTALKERTGKTEAELYNDGNPAHKKMVVFARSARKWKHGLGGDLNNYNYGNTFDGGGLFGNETVDTVASFLPILGTAEDAYQFYQNPSWSNAGWLALSLGSDIFTGGMASRGIKALRAANKAVDAAKAANKAAVREWRAVKTANGANHTRESGTRVRHAIKAAGSAGAVRNAAIKRANDALFEAGVYTGIDQGVNGFLNAAQMDMLPTFGLQYGQEHGLGGNLFSGEENHSQQMITTGGAGYIPAIVDDPVALTRKYLYTHVLPISDYNIGETIKGALEGEFEYRKRNDPKFDYEKEYPQNTDYTTISGTKAPLSVVDGIWAEYLQIPQKDRKKFVGPGLRRSKYVPSIGRDKNNKYYALPLTSGAKRLIVNEAQELPYGKNKVTNTLETLGRTVFNLGDHTVGRGYDEKGDYVSYYDVFDLNPFSDKYHGTNIPLLNKLEDASFGIGKPVHIYDRIYLDDYYGVKEPTHAAYLPEVVVTGKKRKK